MTPDEYIRQLGQLLAELKDREALDFAAEYEPTVQPPLTIEQIDLVAGALQGAAMAVAMIETRAREAEMGEATEVTPAQGLASRG